MAMTMSEHDKIRELLALAAAGALTSAEENQVAEHVRSCIACSNELEAWRPIASELRRLPTPQPSSWLVQATLARAEAELTERAEHDWNRRVMIAVVAFAWLLTIASWPVFRFVSGRFGSWLSRSSATRIRCSAKHGSVLPRSPRWGGSREGSPL
jgi:anti-sigma factor RsiW